MIRIAEPRIGEAERRAVLEVLASGRLTSGPYTQRLEAAFARDVSRTAEAVAVSSGTAALHLALLAHDVGPGDEVITTPFSFQATANMVLATGARPVFVDVGPDGNLDATLVEAAITPRTKVILPVHLYGRLCDMPALCDIAARHGLALIEDAAQAHGAYFTSMPAETRESSSHPSAGSGVPPASPSDAAQSHGAYFTSMPAETREGSSHPSAGSGVPPASPSDAAQAHGAKHTSSPSLPAGRGQGGGVSPTACYSLYATKNLTAGEGGVVTTDDPQLAQRLRRLRSHGEIDRYESVEIGYNYRITEVGAALALTQLEGLAAANQRRRENAAYLSQHLRGVELPELPSDPASHVWHQYTIRVPAAELPLSRDEDGGRGGPRDALQAHLRERGIEAMVYYPKTLPAQKLYRDLGYDDDGLPVARRLAREVLSLPVHPGLSQADLQAIVDAVNEWTAVHAKGKVTSK